MTITQKTELEIRAVNNLKGIYHGGVEYVNSTTRNHVFKFGEIKITIPKKLLR